MMESVQAVEKHFNVSVDLVLKGSQQGRSRRSGWSGFGRTTISQGKNKITFYRKQVINKSTRVVFGLVQLVIL